MTNLSSHIPHDSQAASVVMSSNQYVTFSCGERIFGVDIMSVREIRSWSPLTELPDLPRGARGVMDIRGRIVTVYDLATLIGTPSVEGAPVVVVVSHDGNDLGIMVSAVSDIIFAQPDQIRGAPTTDKAEGAVAMLVKHEDTLVSVLNLDVLFPRAVERYLID